MTDPVTLMVLSQIYGYLPTAEHCQCPWLVLISFPLRVGGWVSLSGWLRCCIPVNGHACQY